MAKTATIHARIEPDLKRQAEAVLGQIGLSTSELITLTYRQLVMRQGLPFDVRIPNAQTARAIAETNAEIENGEAKEFDSVADMMAYLKDDTK